MHRSDEAAGRSRGGLATKVPLVREGWRRPLVAMFTAGQWGDGPQLIPVLERIRVPRPTGGHPRARPSHLCGGNAYSSHRNRRFCGKQISRPTPERRDQPANRRRRGNRGDRPTGFDRARHARWSEVGRTVDALKGSRAAATRYDKRAYVSHGTVTRASIRLRHRQRAVGHSLGGTVHRHRTVSTTPSMCPLAAWPGCVVTATSAARPSSVAPPRVSYPVMLPPWPQYTPPHDSGVLTSPSP